MPHVRALVVAMVLLLLLFVCGEGRARQGENLLEGASPSQSEGVRRARVLTDHVQVADGADWNTDLAAVLTGRRSYVEFDLGREVPIEAIYLQADNNDSYVVSGAPAGQGFRDLWVARPTDRAGMRARSVRALGAKARYLRLSARGGDGSYAVSELQVFSSSPAVFPPRLETRAGAAIPVQVRNSLLMFGLALAGFVFLATARMRWYALAGLALLPIAAAAALASTIHGAWPLESREVALLRAVVAAVALIALVRDRLGGSGLRAHQGVLDGTLAVAALLSAASFYNLGRPQFWNAAESRPEFVHQADMRIYQPFTKYFDELGYDGVYQASVAAYVEDVPGSSLESLRRVEIRSMKTHRIERVEHQADEIARIAKRFTPERWAEFKADMAYFRETMGTKSYLATHTDHGANATPVWVALARLCLAFVAASERSLVFGGLLDPLLLAAMFVAVGLTFGRRPMLLAIVVFGATDLYMFGTNWAGATLRHDWLAYLGFAACALRRERWALGGALLGLAVMIRAFPVVALAGVGSALGVGFLERWLRERRLPSLRAALKEHAPALRVLAGAAACIVVSVAVTSALFGFGRWVEWWNKVALLDSDIGTNDVSLRALVAYGPGQSPGDTLRARTPLYVTVSALTLALVAAVTRRVRIDQAALLALPLVVIAFNPANYYAHFIALLPLLGANIHTAKAAGEDTRPVFSHLAISGPLLGLCVVEYWTVLDPDFDRHFQLETLFTFGALGWIYANVARSLWPELASVWREQPSAVPAQPDASRTP